MQNKLYYLGHASLKITTRENKVIYIDPYMGDDYADKADLILVTHGHFDHNEISKVENRAEDFRLITHKEALKDGEYQIFDLGYAKIETVEAGYNSYHNKDECVGYVIILSDETKIYVAGDTYITPQMDKLADYNFDYALIPCDGIYTMTVAEAMEAANKVKARHTIPYHTISDGSPFDEKTANSFDVQGKIILRPKEEIILSHMN